MKSPENKGYTLRQKIVTGIAATAALGVGLGLGARSGDSYKGPNTIVMEGQTVPVEELARKLGSGDSVTKVYAQPFPGAGGSKAAKEGSGRVHDFGATSLEDSDIREAERLAGSFGAEFQTAVELKSGMHINIYKSGAGKLGVNPEGVGDMVQSILSTVPYVPRSPYKQDAMVLSQKAERGELGNMQVNIIVSADAGTIVDGPGRRFITGDSTAQSSKTSLGLCLGPTLAMEGVNRKHQNITLVAARPAQDADIPGIVIHELGHAFTIASSTDAENLGRAGDISKVNEEHSKFVFPVSSLAGIVYEASVKAGFAEPAFTFSGK